MEESFTCPECGAHEFSSINNKDGTLTRYCEGYGCYFQWNSRNDQYYLKPVQKEEQHG